MEDRPADVGLGSLSPWVSDASEPRTRLEPRPGTYVLLMEPRPGTPERVRIGRLGVLRRPAVARLFLYVGSALGPGGVRARVRRHARRRKSPHWHVDHLRPHCRLAGAWLAYGRRRAEHEWADRVGRLPGASVPLPGFGASDCGCAAHLFAFGEEPDFAAFAASVPDEVERFR